MRLFKKTPWQQYMYMFKPGQLMVGHIRGTETKDYYYLNKGQTAHYIKTGELPHKITVDKLIDTKPSSRSKQ